MQVRLEAVAHHPVGYLASDDDGGVAFQYDVAYLDLPGAHPISFSLPLREAPFDDRLSQAFFRNLLPENDQLRSILDREGIDRDDTIGLLAHLGTDLSGALSCLPQDSAPFKVPGNLYTDYDLLPAAELHDIVARLGEGRPLPAGLRDPSPVAGYQRKIALVHLGGDAFALPRPGTGVPSTHILKVPTTDLPREALLEARAAQLARSVGLDAAPSQARWIGQYEVLIATRFDRNVTAEGDISRLHQEDFAQALGLPARLKYERDGRPGRIYDIAAIDRLLRRTIDPALARDAFMRATIFNLAIGNTDNHAKNHALLYDDGPIPRLAPLYDLVPIMLSDVHHHEFALSIGRARTIADLEAGDLTTFLAALGLKPAGIRRFTGTRLTPMLRKLAELQHQDDHWIDRFHTLIQRQARHLMELGGQHLRA